MLLRFKLVASAMLGLFLKDPDKYTDSAQPVLRLSVTKSQFLLERQI